MRALAIFTQSHFSKMQLIKGGNLKMSHFLFTLGVFNLNYLW